MSTFLEIKQTKTINMKERHHVAVQMEEEQQWKKDNGPRTIDLNNYFAYSGEIEESVVKLMTDKAADRTRMVVMDGGIYSVLSEKRSRILAYWLDNMDTPMKEIGEILGCDYVTVSRTIKKYLNAFKDIKNEDI